MTFTFRGKPVFIPGPAEVPPCWHWPSGGGLTDQAVRSQVQVHLDRISGAELPVDQILHAQILLDRTTVPCQVIPTEENSHIIWGVHTKHTSRRPGISPFVNADWARKLHEDSVSVEYSIKDDGVFMITRMYPGSEYQPPLPWMGSVDNAPGGLPECIEYWRKHAFVLHPGSFKNPEAPRATPPDWWKPIS